jgi:hypothetical protein
MPLLRILKDLLAYSDLIPSTTKRLRKGVGSPIFQRIRTWVSQ